jgi:hypothetical protein
MQKLKEIFTGLLRDAASLPDDKMRAEAFSRRVKTLDAAEVALLLDMLYGAPLVSSVRKLKATLVSPDMLMEALGPEKYRNTYLSALEMGLKKISGLFTDLPPLKKGLYGYSEEEEAKMEFLTLGMRRSLARTNIKDTLDRLLSDPDPVVIRNVLDNPRITEKEVLKVASKRPNSPQILKLIATHTRWSKRYDVIKAIVQNPYTPPRISIAMLDFLLRQDLKKIASDSTLHPQVRSGATRAMDRG